MSLDALMAQLQSNTAQIKQRRAEAEQSMTAAAASMVPAPMPTMDSSGGGGKSGGKTSSGGTSAPVAGGKFNANAPMTTMNFKGMSYQVNSTVANRFQGFLKDLAKRGYIPSSIGGYANRNIAGSSTKSLHSYGLAIDIDPAKNPVTYGYVKTALPRGVGGLARKHGLVWGGNWNGSKKDTMHFSVPYGGTK